MKPEVRKAFAAANAAEAVLEVARHAHTLLEADPSDWAFGDQAYWLCRTAQETAYNAATALDPEEAQDDQIILEAFAAAMAATDNLCAAADELVSLAAANEHEIRR